MYAPYHIYSTEVSIQSLRERVSMSRFPERNIDTLKYRNTVALVVETVEYSDDILPIQLRSTVAEYIERRVSTSFLWYRWRSLPDISGYSRMADPVVVVVSVKRAARYGGTM